MSHQRGICRFCGADLVWKSDQNLEDTVFMDKGVLSILECPQCGAEAMFVKREESE